MNMTRLSVCLCVTYLISIFVAPPSALARTYKWRVASAWNRQHPNNVPLFHLIAAVNKECHVNGDRLELEWVGGPETFKAADLPGATTAGSIDFFLSSNLYYFGIVPESAITTIPYAWSFDNASKMWHAGLAKLADKAWQKKGLRVISFESILSFYFYTRKPFANLSDFKGKRLRVPGGLFALIPKYMGAVSTPLATAETYGAMERGTIDGGMNALSTYTHSSYWEVAPNVLNYPFTIVGAWFWVNAKKFDDLPKGLLNKLLDIARRNESFVVSYWKEQDAKWKKEMRAHKVNFISLPPKDEAELRQSIKALKNKVAETIPPEESRMVFSVYDRFAR